MASTVIESAASLPSGSSTAIWWSWRSARRWMAVRMRTIRRRTSRPVCQTLHHNRHRPPEHRHPTNDHRCCSLCCCYCCRRSPILPNCLNRRNIPAIPFPNRFLWSTCWKKTHTRILHKYLIYFNIQGDSPSMLTLYSFINNLFIYSNSDLDTKTFKKNHHNWLENYLNYILYIH